MSNIYKVIYIDKRQKILAVDDGIKAIVASSKKEARHIALQKLKNFINGHDVRIECLETSDIDFNTGIPEKRYYSYDGRRISKAEHFKLFGYD